MERHQPFLLRCTHGRLALELRLLPAGQDWQLLLTGGDAHIGAVILAEPGDGTPPDAPKAASAGSTARPDATSAGIFSGTEDGVRLHVLRRAGHHDDEAALPLARDYCRALGAAVCVSAGIHYDHISREEIDTVLALARMLGACGLRLIWVATVFPLYRTPATLYFSYPVSWLITGAVHVVFFLCIRRRAYAKVQGSQYLAQSEGRHPPVEAQ